MWVTIRSTFWAIARRAIFGLDRILTAPFRAHLRKKYPSDDRAECMHAFFWPLTEEVLAHKAKLNAKKVMGLAVVAARTLLIYISLLLVASIFFGIVSCVSVSILLWLVIDIRGASAYWS